MKVGDKYNKEMEVCVITLLLSWWLIVAHGFEGDRYCGNVCSCDRGTIHCNITDTGICLPVLLSEISGNISTVEIKGGRFHCSRDTHVFNYTNIVNLNIVESELDKVDMNLLAVVPKIEKLILKGNKIKFINFSNLERDYFLEIIDLSYNEISSLEQNTFQGLPFVKELNLSYNKLFSLCNTTVFETLTLLHTLDLSHNNLTYIHPQAFPSLSELHTLYLNDNSLSSLQKDIFSNVTLLQNIYLGNNPWDCHCGINWITDEINSNITWKRYMDIIDMKCWSPEIHNSTLVAHLNASDVVCEAPAYVQNSSYLPKSLSIVFLGTAYLHCQAEGYPKPSIYWIGPRGVLIHESQHEWLPPQIETFNDYQYWIGKPLYAKTSVRALVNGSLVFENFRRNFEGEYICVARNPVGEISTAVNVTVTLNLKSMVVESALFGIGCSFAVLLIGFSIGASQWIAERTCCKKNIEESAIEQYYSEDVPPSVHNIEGEDYWYEYFKKLPYEYPDPTSRQSPMKCVTPAEAIDAEENHSLADAGVWQVLDDVRTNLRNSLTRQAEWVRSQTQNVRDSGRQLKTDVGRKVERVKYKAHMIKQSGSHYVQHIKESSSTKLKTIRSSSSQYALRVRTGMVGTVEEVRGRVKSFKEFCGTGDIGQTVSVASVSTNVDSQVQTIDYKSHTLV